jgi:Zn-dependent M28 family amino/carboxypeptidase
MYFQKPNSTVARLTAALTFAIILPLGAQTISFVPVAQDLLEQRLKRVAGESSEREQTLKKLFEEAGCKQVIEQEVKGATTPNVVCTLQGSEKTTVVIGAHYDKASKGDSVVDDWSGAALLPSLLQSLNATPRRLTFVFVGFADQRKGLRGSKAYVKDLKGADRDSVKAMLNVDSVGLGPTMIWVGRGDKNLVQSLSKVAASMKLPIKGMDLDATTQTDSLPFIDRQIPTLDFHSLTSATLQIPGSAADKAELIQMAEYGNTCRLLSGYLAYLDISFAKQTATAGK